jgi:hypothetical protein
VPWCVDDQQAWQLHVECAVAAQLGWERGKDCGGLSAAAAAATAAAAGDTVSLGEVRGNAEEHCRWPCGGASALVAFAFVNDRPWRVDDQQAWQLHVECAVAAQL